MASLRDTGTALILDSDDDVRRGCAAMLTAAGMSVRVTARAEEALAVIAEGGVDVVVSNVSLGGLSGPDLLREIRARDPELPVVFVTGWPAFDAPTEVASGSSGGARTTAEALRGMVVTAAVGYRVGKRARRRGSGSPQGGDGPTHA